MLSKRRTIVIAAIVSGFIILIVGGLLVSRFLSKGTELNPGQKQEIFRQIINNNPSTVLNSDNRDTRAQGEAASLALDIADSSTTSLIVSPLNRNYSYKFSKTTYNNGPALGRCQNNVYDNTLHTSESYEFFSENGDSYSKYIQRDRDEDLISYNLNKYLTTSSEYIEYRGGSYAIKTSYTFDRPASTEVLPQSFDSVGAGDSTAEAKDSVDYSALIYDYFGPDVDIVNTITENGQEYYIVQYTYKTDCSGQAYQVLDLAGLYNPANLPDTIVVQNYVNSSNFEIQKTFNYLGLVDSNNLINSTFVEQQMSNATFSEVSNNFDFVFNVSVRDFTYPEYNAENEANKLISYLSENNLTLLFINNARLQSVYSSDLKIKDYEKYNYYADRNFYPAGAKGDAMFEASNRTYIQEGQTESLLSLSYYLDSETSYSFIVDVYDFSRTLPDSSQTPTNTTSVNLNIDGQSVPATLYEYEADITPPDIVRPTTGTTDITDNPENIPVKFIIREVILEFAGNKYKITLPQDFDINSITFEALDSSNSSEITLIRSRIREVLLNPKSVEGR